MAEPPLTGGVGGWVQEWEEGDELGAKDHRGENLGVKNPQR